MSRTTKDPMDIHVGKRLRERRTAAGWSQEKLALALGVSFQQVQKYENGTNRAAAGRLMQVAKALDVPVGWFFENGPVRSPAKALKVAEDTAKGIDNAVLTSPESIALLTAYYALPAKQRKELLAGLKAKKA